jgi:hypothetical protein
VVAWEAKNETGDPRILHESAEELGPLRRTARISDVSGNQDKIEKGNLIASVGYGITLAHEDVELLAKHPPDRALAASS